MTEISPPSEWLLPGVDTAGVRVETGSSGVSVGADLHDTLDLVADSSATALLDALRDGELDTVSAVAAAGLPPGTTALRLSALLVRSRHCLALSYRPGDDRWHLRPASAPLESTLSPLVTPAEPTGAPDLAEPADLIEPAEPTGPAERSGGEAQEVSASPEVPAPTSRETHSRPVPSQRDLRTSHSQAPGVVDAICAALRL